MKIREILEKRGWKAEKLPYGTRMVTALRHPKQPILYLVQAHVFRANARDIAKINSKNVSYDEHNDLIIVDGFIAIKP